jgi:hypothetical protein
MLDSTKSRLIGENWIGAYTTQATCGNSMAPSAVERASSAAQLALKKWLAKALPIW